MNIEYRSPDQNSIVSSSYTHSLFFEKDGIPKANLEYLYIGGFYYLFYIGVYQKFRGEGYGRMLLTEFNSMLTRKKVNGILRNIIDPNHPTRNFYQNHNWQYLSAGNDWMIHKNTSFSNQHLQSVINRIKKLEELGAFMVYH